MAELTAEFTYVLSNDAMPGMVKIGFSSRLPEDRLRDSGLRNTGVPLDFEVRFRALTSHAREVEKRVHQMLAPNRVNIDREFFRISVQDAIGAIRTAMLDVAGIAAWSKAPLHRLRSKDRVVLSVRRTDVFVLLAYPNLASSSPEVLDIWEAHSDGDALELTSADAGTVAGMSDDDPRGQVDPVPFLNRDRTAPNGLVNGRERLVPGDRLLWLSAAGPEGQCMSALFEIADYCQVVSRTWSPKLAAGGQPLLLNTLTQDEMPEPLVQATQDAMALPRPREWAPRGSSDPDDDWVTIDTDPQGPEYWLPQLKPAQGKKKRTPWSRRSK